MGFRAGAWCHLPVAVVLGANGGSGRTANARSSCAWGPAGGRVARWDAVSGIGAGSGAWAGCAASAPFRVCRADILWERSQRQTITPRLSIVKTLIHRILQVVTGAVRLLYWRRLIGWRAGTRCRVQSVGP